ncbi:amino acid adenylation domain-containing protein [Streptomyces sp. NPDC048514]|uniref:non-ribosomal peptide synthetase n=1 Tax=Streptomyces sp. NPDC048514 TaxID=3365564 RepID=UPI00371E3271
MNPPTEAAAPGSATTAELIVLAAHALGQTRDQVASHAAHLSFVSLGGTSLRAVDLVARAEHAGAALDLPRLLGEEPLAAVLHAAQAHTPGPVRTDEAPRRERDASPAEAAMLLSEEAGSGSAWHLMFSADLDGPLDVARLGGALQAVTDRHDAMRTVFTRRPDGLRARVIPGWRPRLLQQSVDLPPGDAGVGLVHTMLASASTRLLAPFERPAVVFVLTRSGGGRHVLSLLIHHVLADGWSIGVLWREIFGHYRGASTGAAPLPVPLPDPERIDALAARRTAELAGAPTVVRFPGDLPGATEFDHRGVRLPVDLDPAVRDGVEALARRCGVTRNTVLLTAWSVTAARRLGTEDLLVGLTWAGRDSAREQRFVGLLTTLLPVRCRAGAERTVSERVADVGQAVRAALQARQVPFERLTAGLGVTADTARNALIQVAFAAHDEMVPAALDVPGLGVRIHEGHCGGAIFDALLYVQRWADRPRLCVEYATSAFTPWEAAQLVADFRGVLGELVDGANADRRVTELHRERPFSDGPFSDGPFSDRLFREGPVGEGPVRERPVREGPVREEPVREGLLVERPAGPAPGGAESRPGHTDVWRLVETVARLHPDAPAVVDPAAQARPLTYRELVRAVEAQSASLRTAGVEAGDHVIVAVPRSAREVVSVLAVLRSGAAYVGLEPGLPEHFLHRVFGLARPALVLADPGRAVELHDAGLDVPVLHPLDPWAPTVADAAVPAADPDPGRVAYIAFTSGSTGRPKAVRIPHRAVCRLVADDGVVRRAASRRFVRLAPLSFDASTLELFAPLAAGGAVVVHPDRHPTPGELAGFLAAHAVTGLWLTAGLFRLVADHAPWAFRGVDQLLTGGDTVPAAQVRRVLAACPGLRVTNGYGPTENTTFTTVHHVDDAAEVGATLPIGRPVAGTSVTVLDSSGQAVPRGATGELCTAGSGLAVDYLDDPAETERAFGHDPEGRRYYRTGDLVRWDADGNLRILGRRDRQVKIRGFRLELDGIAAELGRLPGVTDAVVAATGDDRAEARLVAGIVTAEPGPDPAALRRMAAARLPGHAVPALWAVCRSLPTTANGKVDVAALTALALGTAAPGTDDGVPERPAAHTEGPAGTRVTAEEIEDRIAEIWEDVLGTSDFGYDDRFADVGGNSLALPRIRTLLLGAYPSCDIRLTELFRYPTIAQLAAFVHGKMTDTA